MKAFHKLTFALVAIMGLLASSLGIIGVPAADAVPWGTDKEDDPDYNTPGFPLPV